MTDIASNNKRIAKNTLFLYFRMLLIMGVNLYTVRVVLETLGVVDYGIYNVVGGVVTMFSFLSGTMASASQRFFSFELGRNDLGKLKQTFSMTMQIYVLLGMVILLLAETVGLWFLNTQMNIPADRMDAARWVYQFAVLSFMLTMFTTPYNAAIIAREDMKVYAYISIVEVVLKLLIVYLLLLFLFDKLKLYAVLIFAVTLIVSLIYRIYCKKKYRECCFTPYWDKNLFKELVGFSGWNLFGALAGVVNNQGLNILLNIFFGPVVNAARGIAFQINGAISQFVQNFMTASRPQITKYYATEELDSMHKLVFRTSKFSYFLLFVIAMPVLLETNTVLSLWLRDVPQYVSLFTQLTIATALIETLSFALMAAAQATGKIKKYQAVVGSVMMLNLPVSYIFLKSGYAPESVFYVSIANACICLLLRLLFLRKMIALSFGCFIKEVLLPVVCVTLFALIVPFFIEKVLFISAGFSRLLIIVVACVISSFITIYFAGFSSEEKDMVNKTLKNKFKRRK